MKKTTLFGALVLLWGVSGCGSDSHETYIKDMIRIINETRTVLSRIKDAKTADEQAPLLKEKGENLRALRRKVETLKEPLSKEEKEQLAKEYKEKLQKATQDVADEWNRVKEVKGAVEALNKRGALDDWGYVR